MEALNKQTLIDFSPLSITPKQKYDDDWDEQQAEHRKDMYNIRLAIEDSGIELVLMSDRLVQNDALQMLAARSDTLANRLGQIAERRRSLKPMTTTTTRTIAAGHSRKSLKSFDRYCREPGLPQYVSYLIRNSTER